MSHKPKKHSITFDVSAKKGDVQTVRFAISHDIPYPDFESTGSDLKWRNFGKIFDRYGHEPGCLERRYTFSQITLDADIGDGFNRMSCPGFTHGRFNENTVPGAIMLRGCSLGELNIQWSEDYPSIFDINVRGFSHPSKFERDFIKEQICPKLTKYVNQNRDELRRAAIDAIKANVEDRVSRMRIELRNRHDEMMRAINLL